MKHVQQEAGPAWSKSMLKPFKVKQREVEKCANCMKPVYAAEEVKANSKVYHKLCLKCYGCTKMLDAGSVVEHLGLAYCQNCYMKLMRKEHRVSEVEAEYANEFETRLRE